MIAPKEITVIATSEQVRTAPVTEEQDFEKSWTQKPGRDRRERSGEKPQKEFEEKLLEVRKVTKVTTWGRRLWFRATILIGNRKGKVGLGVGKWSDVSVAVRKAAHAAYKNVMTVRITKDGSVLYPMVKKFKSCIVKILPAAPGTGIKAWSAVRSVLELAGYKNILSKIVWANNSLNNALVTLAILTGYKVKDSHKAHILEVDTKKVEDPRVKEEQSRKEGGKQDAGDKKYLKKPTTSRRDAGVAVKKPVVQDKKPVIKWPKKSVVATATPAEKA